MENAELFSSENNLGDHFAVEELLNLTETDDKNDPFVDNSDTALESSHSSVSGEESSFTGQIIDLCVPNDDIAELEWLSNFVDHDSFSSEDLQNLRLISGTKPTSEAGSETQLQIESSIPVKSRTKRPHPIYFESHPIHCQSDQTVQWIVGPMGPETPSNDHPAPKKKKRVVVGAEGRRCLHCDTDKTPQWRTGPMGPKTLCNACGVRYKSGRLVPEYRPAASPTFVMDEHSNSHRKVIELRRKKDGHKFDQGDGMMLFDGSNSDSYLIHHPMGPDFRHLI